MKPKEIIGILFIMLVLGIMVIFEPGFKLDKKYALAESTDSAPLTYIVGLPSVGKQLYVRGEDALYSIISVTIQTESTRTDEQITSDVHKYLGDLPVKIERAK